MDDLKSSGLWQETLIIWMGDFGRTPTINGQQGRDHFPRISNVVLGGGSIRGGTVVGKTNENGTEIVDEPVSTADLFATILSKIDIAPDELYETTFGSPTKATDDGAPIRQLV